MTRHPVGVELFRENTWTDITKLIVAFCNFVNVPKKVYTLPPPNSWINHVTVEVLHISIIFFFFFSVQKLAQMYCIHKADHKGVYTQRQLILFRRF